MKRKFRKHRVGQRNAYSPGTSTWARLPLFAVVAYDGHPVVSEPFRLEPGTAMDFLEREIQRAAETDQLVAIVGAGIAIGATGGRPSASWTGLLKSGLERCLGLGYLQTTEYERL